MNARHIFVWAGVVATLYALCLAVFYSSTVATIIAIKGFGLLTWPMMHALFLEAAVICIPLAVLSALLVVFGARR